ncbi:cupredoxin domain-containing protein [Haloarcula laminariae]|uniref:cupredoxin domain-containing protein n=1 Tax=Haloarcula laminariae TaxID=2961577 RepID=UPI0021C78E35|nr:plastocyanin/azurin family copper-binding protein [Halomicroarcula laminariae]
MSRKLYNRRIVLRLGAATLATLSTAGCLSGETSSTQTVTMPDNHIFEPKTATVESGETVMWTNESNIQHTVTAYEDEVPNEATYFASGGFGSERAARNRISEGLIAPGKYYEHTFNQPGTYRYYCIPHESSGMVGTIQVG